MSEQNECKDRIRCSVLKDKLISPDDAAMFFKPDMTVGCSGFTPVGYPKVIPMAIAERAKKYGPMPLSVWCGASSGKELDEALALAGCIKCRYPYQSNKILREMINEGSVDYSDYHLSMGGQNLRYGFYGKMDYALIEATAITEEGDIIPGLAVGDAPNFIKCADRVFVEININLPAELEGIHDIFIPEDPPFRKPLMVTDVRSRIGHTAIKCPVGKIAGIVPSSLPDQGVSLAGGDRITNKIAMHLLDFLDIEVKNGKLPCNLLPLQFGVGRIANDTMAGLVKWPGGNLNFYSEVLQDSILDIIDAGKLDYASGTSLTMSPSGRDRFLKNINNYKKNIVLRSEEISNSPEIIRRLGVIAVNTAAEFDIYGHVNSTYAGNKIINGIGGSGDFARNAYLTIFICPSVRGVKNKSSVVCHCSHVDHTEHDVDILITENGVADIRGLTRKNRARLIIEKCAHPQYKNYLSEQMNRDFEFRFINKILNCADAEMFDIAEENI